jgi:hypothetical protein
MGKLDNFIFKLESLGYTVKQIRTKPQIYTINGSLVNIRSRGKAKQTANRDRLFWYDIAFSVLKEVKWVIYLTTGDDNFVMLRSSVLESLKDRMYPNKKHVGKGVFSINWDESTIELSDGSEYTKCYNLKDKEDYPQF